MAARSEFVDHVVDALRDFGAVRPRAMFGGWGLYRDGLFFALIAGDVLYLKVDEENRVAFESRGLPPFVYETRLGERMVMSYRQAPAEALETPAAMAEWAQLAYAAALRAALARATSKRPAAKPRA